MAKQEKAGSGFQASAGLIRYFDSEEKSAFRINPWVVISIALATGIGITMTKIVFPL